MKIELRDMSKGEEAWTVAELSEWLSNQSPEKHVRLIMEPTIDGHVVQIEEDICGAADAGNNVILVGRSCD